MTQVVAEFDAANHADWDRAYVDACRLAMTRGQIAVIDIRDAPNDVAVDLAMTAIDEGEVGTVTCAQVLGALAHRQSADARLTVGVAAVDSTDPATMALVAGTMGDKPAGSWRWIESVANDDLCEKLLLWLRLVADRRSLAVGANFADPLSGELPAEPSQTDPTRPRPFRRVP